MTASEIAKGLPAAEREAWKNAEWQGEYYAPPYDVEHNSWVRAGALSLGLVNRDWSGDYCVTSKGHDLVVYLNRPSIWQRVKAAVRAILEQESRGE